MVSYVEPSTSPCLMNRPCCYTQCYEAQCCLVLLLYRRLRQWVSPGISSLSGTIGCVSLYAVLIPAAAVCSNSWICICGSLGIYYSDYGHGCCCTCIWLFSDFKWIINKRLILGCERCVGENDVSFFRVCFSPLHSLCVCGISSFPHQSDAIYSCPGFLPLCLFFLSPSEHELQHLSIFYSIILLSRLSLLCAHEND